MDALYYISSHRIILKSNEKCYIFKKLGIIYCLDFS